MLLKRVDRFMLYSQVNININIIRTRHTIMHIEMLFYILHIAYLLYILHKTLFFLFVLWKNPA